VIKIGITDNVERRLRHLSSQSPTPIRLLISIRGTTRQEYVLHRMFASDRRNGEWFTASEQLLAFIAWLRCSPADVIAARLRSLRTPKLPSIPGESERDRRRARFAKWSMVPESAEAR
jgi:hypothetical protein